MKRVNLTGDKNGSNVSFTLPETSVSDGVTLLVHTNLFLHAVTGPPEDGEYRIVDDQVTLGLAPNTPDELYAFVTTSLNTSLVPVILTGVQDGSNNTFSFSDSLVSNASLIVLLAGNVLAEIAVVASVGQFHAAASLLGTTLTLGLAPNQDDKLVVYQEIAATAPMVQLSYSTLTSTDVLTSAVAPVGTLPAILVIYTGVALTESSGTPNVNEYASSLAGTTLKVRFGLAPNETDHVDLYLLSNAAIPIVPAGAAYEIFQNVYPLGPEVEYLFSVASQTPMREVSVFLLDRIDPTRNWTADTPTAYAYRGRDDLGRLLIEVYPVPSRAALVHYAGIRRDACLQQTHVLRHLDALILNAATAAVFLMIVAKTSTAEPWTTLAQSYQAKADRLLERLLDLDFTRSGVALVQGMREDSGFDTGVYVGGYLADSDWWLH